MPQKLTEPPEEKLRLFIGNNIRPAEMFGYDPLQGDTQATDYLPVTKNWSDYGDYFPMVLVGQDADSVIPGGGESNYNSIQGDGSGGNQFAINPIRVAVITSQGGAYLNGENYYDVAHKIYSEIKYQTRISKNLDSETAFDGALEPATTLRGEGENNGSTETDFRLQGSVPVGVLYEP